MAESLHSRTLGDFVVTNALPIEEYDCVSERVSEWSRENETVWFTFASAWNGVAYRLRAAHEHAEAFETSNKVPLVPIPNARYRQDDDLFGFATAAVSAIECFCFAAHCIGALLNPKVFLHSSTTDLKFYPEQVRDRLSAAYPDASLTTKLVNSLAGPNYRWLRDF